jgi:hypothetical protein
MDWPSLVATAAQPAIDEAGDLIIVWDAIKAVLGNQGAVLVLIIAFLYDRKLKVVVRWCQAMLRELKQWRMLLTRLANAAERAAEKTPPNTTMKGQDDGDEESPATSA